MTTSPPNLVRRQLLAGGAGALATAGLAGVSTGAKAQAPAAPASAAAASAAKPLPAYVSWKNPELMIQHTATTIETKRSAFGTSVVTPNDRLYIRNNLPAPDVSIVANRDAWVLAVEGVKGPRTLTVADLKSMGLETMATVLQCSGNGRGYFPSKPSGTKWQVGAAGCVLWSGVPVRTVVAALGGVAGDARFMTGTGGEKLPDGLDPKSVMVERSVPLKTMEDALLAWEMNGEALPHAHGGPLRLIVPGYSGVNNIKYIKRLAFTAQETDAAIQKTGYRMSPPGQKGDPSHPAVWEMDPKSWINGPAPEAGPRQGRLGADPRRRHGRHAGRAPRGSFHRRWPVLARGPAGRPGPGPLRLAPIRAAGQAGAGQLRAGFARAGRQVQLAGRNRPRKMRAAISIAAGAPMRLPVTVA